MSLVNEIVLTYHMTQYWESILWLNLHTHILYFHISKYPMLKIRLSKSLQCLRKIFYKILITK